MSNLRLVLVTVSFITSFYKVSIAQEPFNTQLAYYSVARNPALAGLNTTDLQFNFSYEHQNKKILVPYRSLQAEIISRYRMQNSSDGFSIGAFIKYDEAGSNQLKSAQFLPVINFHKSLSDVQESYLSFAFIPGIYKTQFDLNTLPTIQQYNPSPFSLASPDLQLAKSFSSNYIDFTTGLSFYTDINPCLSFYSGVALFHFSQNILKQNTIVPKQHRTWVLNTGIKWKYDRFTLQLLADLRISKTEKTVYCAAIIGFPIFQNPFMEATALNIGTYFNSESMLSPTVSISMPHFSFAISYDLYTRSIHNLPIQTNAVASTISVGINSHKRNNESEKMRCKL